MTTVNFNIYTGTAYTWMLEFAKEQGFFKRNGIDANLQATASAPTAFSGLLGGSLQFAAGDMINGGVVLDAGTALQIVAGTMKGNQSLMIGAASAHLPNTFPAGIKALVGKKVGVVSVGSAAYYYARLILTAGGVNPDSVSYVATTANPAQISAALESGQVAAAVVPLSAAYGLVNVQHHTVLFNQDTETASLFPGKNPDPSDLPATAPLRLIVDKSHTWLWCTKEWADGHADIIRRVRLALMEADVWLHNPANTQAAVDYLIKQVAVFPGQSTEDVRKFLANNISLLISYVPEEDVSAYQHVYATNGVLPKELPTKQFLAPGTPKSAADVVSQVKAAGAGALGSAA